MEANESELENLLSNMDLWLKKLINLGLSFENSGQYEEAMNVYIKGLEKTDKAKVDISTTILGLLD